MIFLDLRITTVDEENVVYYINIKPTRYRVIRIIKSSIRVFMGAAMFCFFLEIIQKAEEGLLCYVAMVLTLFRLKVVNPRLNYW